MDAKVAKTALISLAAVTILHTPAAGAALPVYFERNSGQAPGRAEYIVRAADYSAWMTRGGADFSLKRGSHVTMGWKGANPAPRIESASPLEARSNYFVGSDPSQWKRNVPHFGKVVYRSLYPGVDLIFYANGNNLEHDFVVAPGADPRRIRVAFDGARAVRIDSGGDLLIETPGGSIRQKRPAIYQGRQPVRGGWVLGGKREAYFDIGAYDHSKPLVIDPIISFDTNIGGGAADSSNAITVGPDGSVYITGNTGSTNFPTIGSILQSTYGGGPNDVFVVKLDFTGTKIVWATYLGGNGNDIGGGIKVDPSGNVYVAGFTGSTNFPTTTGQRSFGGGNFDGFVVKLPPAGNSLLYSTYVGGNGTDLVFSLAIDAAGSAYLAGATNSTNFPAPSPVQGKLLGAVNAIVAKVDPSGASVVWGTYLGGSGQDAASSLALDSDGKIYVAGFTSSPNFPTSPDGLQRVWKGGNDAFVVRLDPAAGSNGLLYGTYIGGSADDVASGIILDNDGGLYIAGRTASADFPATAGSQKFGGAPSDGFLAKFAVPAGALRLGSTAARTATRPRGMGGSPQEQFIRLAGFAGLELFEPVKCGDRVCVFGSIANPLAFAYVFGLAGFDIRPTDNGFVICFDTEDGSVVYYSALRLDPSATSKVDTGGDCPEIFFAGGGMGGLRLDRMDQRRSIHAGNACDEEDPISTATGELFHEFTDLTLNGPFPIQFQRYYGSLLRTNNFTSSLGSNWMHSYNQRIVARDTSATVYLFRGKSVRFNLSNAGWQLRSVEKDNYQLQNGSSGGYLFLDPIENHIYSFNSAGQLTGIADRNGNTVTVTPSPIGPTKVDDGLGRSLTFSYQQNNLTGITDQTGRSLSFVQTNGILSSFTDANGKKYSYTYAGGLARQDLIVSTTEPLGNQPFTQAYDTAGRVISQTDGRGFSALLAYDQGSFGKNTFADARSNMTLYVQPDFENPVTVTDAVGKNRTATYDAQNRITSVTDRLGNTSTLTYQEPSGKIASRTDALGKTTTYSYTAQTEAGFTFYVVTGATFPDGATLKVSYDGSGNPTTATDQAGNTVAFTYNSAGQVVTVTNAAGGVTTVTYNADGTEASVKTPAGDTTHYAYDAAKRLTGLNLADSSAVSLAYDTLDNILKLSDGLGHAKSFAYNDNNFESALTDSAGKQVSLAYDPDDDVTATTDRNGQTTTFAYDQNRLLKTVKSPNGETDNYSYDALNQVSSVLDATNKGPSFGRDSESRVISVVDALSRKTSFTRDALGRVIQATTPLAESYAFSYDSLGRLVKTTNPLGQVSSYSYDPRGLVTAVSLPAGIGAQYQNNALGRVASVTDPNGSVWKSSYDSTGRVTLQTDPLGRKTSLAYDSRNRIASVTLPDATLNVTWDAASNLSALQYSDGTKLQYSYDSDNRLIAGNGFALGYDSEGNVTNSNGLAIARNGAGRVASVQYAPGKTVQYAYDNRGLLTSITDWAGGTTTFTRDAARQLVSVTRPNSVATQFTRDGDRRISSITETSGAKTLSSTTLTRDAEGKVITANRNTPQAATPPPGVHSLGFDAAHQIASAAYDGEGRITKDAIRAYKWDQSSSLASYSGADGSATFTYDALGLRISRTSSAVTQNYVWNYAFEQPAIATVQSGGKDVRYYVCMPDGSVLYSLEASGNARHFYHFDEVGSTVMLTDDHGNITDSYGFTPYGESVTHSGNSDNPYTWLGALGVIEEGSTGLFYMRQRYYDSSSARFLSPDPLPSLQPLQINPYQYVSANPLGFADPSGLQPAGAIEYKNGYGYWDNGVGVYEPKPKPKKPKMAPLPPPAKPGDIITYKHGTGYFENGVAVYEPTVKPKKAPIPPPFEPAGPNDIRTYRHGVGYFDRGVGVYRPYTKLELSIFELLDTLFTPLAGISVESVAPAPFTDTATNGICPPAIPSTPKVDSNFPDRSGDTAFMDALEEYLYNGIFGLAGGQAP